MKRMFVSALCVVAACVEPQTGALAQGVPAAQELRLAFDKEDQVLATPNGNLKIEFTGKPQFVDAKKGKGLLIDAEGVSASKLLITGGNIMNAKQGTIAFWLKPVLPVVEGKQRYSILTATSSTSDNVLNVFIENNGGFYLQAKRDGAWLSPHFNFKWWKKPSWQENTWYHLAVSWEPNGTTKFYVNGARVHEDEAKSYPGFASQLDKLVLGGDGKINSVFDDMLITDRVMSADEISKLATE